MGEGSLWNDRICSLLGQESKAWPSEPREREEGGDEGGEYAVHQPASKRQVTALGPVLLTIMYAHVSLSMMLTKFLFIFPFLSCINELPVPTTQTDEATAFSHVALGCFSSSLL